MNHNVLRSTGKIVVSYGRSAVVFNKIRVDVPVNPLLFDCDQPGFRINRFRNIKGRRPLVMCCPSVDNGLALNCMVLKLYLFVDENRL
jgi:hypothetical protein